MIDLLQIKDWAAGIAEAQGTATDEEEAVAHAIRNPRSPSGSEWIEVAAWLPSSPRCVLATDLEAHFIATWDGTEWVNAWTDEPIDSHVTHWMELPQPPQA